MSAVYPAGPLDVPANLTEPGGSYRRHAWLAVGGLLLFVAVYFALAGWFGWTAWRLFAGVANASSDNAVASVLAGACAAFLAVFMLKALVFVKRGEAADDIEVTAAEQPALFEFLKRLAADTGAPRPHRVFLSGRVNAAVFYDLSIANLLLPSRKNLEIGLGLVNVLTLGELKAVLAHEFGHFAQKSMAVGRWVYIAHQIAAHLVSRRDALDAFLTRLSGIDLRLAWIGWLLRLIIWSIRSLVDLLFRAVLIAQRALSREMEFQADLVAVSVTGSDALIHALHKLSAADDAWDKTLGFAGSELQENRAVKDLFAIQLRIIEKLRSLLGDADYGAAPPLPPQAETHRVFKVALAAPPRMWATHPTNSDREANAKRRYVRAEIDGRSAWTLFNNPQTLRERVSAHMARRATEFKPVDISESLTKLDQQYARGFFHSQYRGAYLGRSIVRHARKVDELYGTTPAPDRVLGEIDALYPESLSADIERLRSLEEERQMLIALREGFLTAPGGVINHRGKEMSRKALPSAIDAVERDVAACAQIVRDHDRRCRAAHFAAAHALGADWAKYLKGLLELLHYADHVEANLLDAHGLLSHTVGVATAGGKVSQTELDAILHAADTAYAALKDVHEAVGQVIPDRTVLNRMKAESWSAALETLALPPPQQSKIGDWLNAAGGWVRSASSSLASLRLAALEQLLAAETQVALFTRKGLKPAAAPPPSVVPREYRLLTPGSERPRKAKLAWWDRFQTASGIVPTFARFIVAGTIVGAVLLVASGVGTSTVYVYNGLERAVVAHINGKETTVRAGENVTVDIGEADHLHVVTTTTSGQPIEEFDATTSGRASQEVYNVAGAGSLVSWVAVYGGGPSTPDELLGAPRWLATHAEVIFKEPPRSVQTHGEVERRTVLTALGGEQVPETMLISLPNDDVRHAVIAQHARWDPSDARFVQQWLGMAMSLPSFPDIVRGRLQDQPREVFNLRAEQLGAKGAAHDAVCERHRKLAASAPDDASLQYVAARCIGNVDERGRAFLSLQQRWPDNAWIAMSASYVRAGEADWDGALKLMDLARRKLPPLQDQMAVEQLRIQRLLAGNTPLDLERIASGSGYLRSALAPEIGDPSSSGAWPAYVSLAHGDLQKALQQALQTKDASEFQQARILRLVAASDGAGADVIGRALELPAEAGLDSDTFLPTLALATRAGRDVSGIVKLAPQVLNDDADKLLTAFTAIRDHAGRAAVETALRGLDARMRGYAYVAAAILDGANCPREWRTAAQRLLFVSERPFLR